MSSPWPIVLEGNEGDLNGRFIPRPILNKIFESYPEIREELIALRPDIVDSEKDLIIIPKASSFGLMGIPAERHLKLQKAMLRHELIHWMRNRKGKMQSTGMLGVRNILRSYREEAIAYANMFPRQPEMKIALPFLVIVGSHMSVSQVLYASHGGVAKAFLQSLRVQSS